MAISKKNTNNSIIDRFGNNNKKLTKKLKKLSKLRNLKSEKLFKS